MEKYKIHFANGWSIENTANTNKDIKLDTHLGYDLPFGQVEFYQGKINWIYDPFKIEDSYINKCKKFEAFYERVSFDVMELKEKWEKIDEFEGTFIDALEYIKENFKG